MEVRRAADAILRSQASPLAAFLAPSTSTRCIARTPLGYRTSLSKPGRRSLTTTCQRRALKPMATTTAPPTSSESANSTQDPSNPFKPAPSTSTPSLESLTSELNWASSPTPRTINVSRGLGPDNPSRQPITNDFFQRMKDKLQTTRAAQASHRFDINRMNDPESASGMMDRVSSGFVTPKPFRQPMKFDATTGRTVNVSGASKQSIDVAKAFTLVEINCSRNKVRMMANKQRFHERGGLKRKRLRRQRWQKRFMEGFKATISRVRHLRKQGW